MLVVAAFLLRWLHSSACVPVVRLCAGGCTWCSDTIGCSLLIFVWLSLHFRFDEIVKKNNVEYHAGGSTQNSVKIAQVSLCLPCLRTPWVCP